MYQISLKLEFKHLHNLLNFKLCYYCYRLRKECSSSDMPKGRIQRSTERTRRILRRNLCVRQLPTRQSTSSNRQRWSWYASSSSPSAAVPTRQVERKSGDSKRNRPHKQCVRVVERRVQQPSWNIHIHPSGYRFRHCRGTRHSQVTSW